MYLGSKYSQILAIVDLQISVYRPQKIVQVLNFGLNMEVMSSTNNSSNNIFKKLSRSYQTVKASLKSIWEIIMQVRYGQIPTIVALIDFIYMPLYLYTTLGYCILYKLASF